MCALTYVGSWKSFKLGDKQINDHRMEVNGSEKMRNEWEDCLHHYAMELCRFIQTYKVIKARRVGHLDPFASFECQTGRAAISGTFSTVVIVEHRRGDGFICQMYC